MIKPFPKPLLPPRNTPERLPRVKAVTIIAGFKSYEGVVLCADTQETVEHTKRKVTKLRFEPHSTFGDTSVNHSNLAAAFCGAGDGPFTDKLIEQAWKAAQNASSLDEACSNITDSIEEQHEKFGKIFQPGYVPETQLIFGVKMDGYSRLFTSLGPVVNEKQGYDSGGIGYYMADFLAGRMYGDHLNIRQCVILAAYILYQAKEHVEGCGGESHIVVLRDNESSGYVDWKRVTSITQLLERSDDQIGQLLLDTASLDTDDKEYQQAVDLGMHLLKTYRKLEQDTLARAAEFEKVEAGAFSVTLEKTDSLGLPTKSSNQTSKDQQ